ncbi:MAG: hypothetical protein AAF721_10230 [Myxococcota bacterium]
MDRGSVLRRGAALGGLLSVLAVGAMATSCKPDAFGCDDDGDCAEDGVCQWSNYCAFTDDTCPSGLRYGEHAGEFSSLCVIAMPGQSPTTGGAGGTEPSDPTGDTSAEPDSGDAGDSADSDGPSSCTCFGLPPGSQWLGPILLQTGESPEVVPECPSVAPSSLLDGVTGFDVAASSCTYHAPECTASAHFFDDASGCGGEPLYELELEPGTCVELASIDQLPKDWSTILVPESDCGCTAQAPTAELPAPTWSGAGSLCGGSADECGEGSTCLPEPDPFAGQAICVHQAGDVDCPLVGYSQKIVLHTGFEDTRACPPCEGDESTCTVLLTDPDCESELADLSEFGECFDFGAVGMNFGLRASDPAGTECRGPATPTGDVTAENPTTVCCIP